MSGAIHQNWGDEEELMRMNDLAEADYHQTKMNKEKLFELFQNNAFTIDGGALLRGFYEYAEDMIEVVESNDDGEYRYNLNLTNFELFTDDMVKVATDGDTVVVQFYSTKAIALR